jgi:hypothetical protein
MLRTTRGSTLVCTTTLHAGWQNENASNRTEIHWIFDQIQVDLARNDCP